jgi:hypothetical protein
MNWFNYLGRRMSYTFFGCVGVGLFAVVMHACHT